MQMRFMRISFEDRYRQSARVYTYSLPRIKRPRFKTRRKTVVANSLMDHDDYPEIRVKEKRRD